MMVGSWAAPSPVDPEISDLSLEERASPLIDQVAFSSSV